MPRSLVLAIICIIAACALGTGQAWAHPAWGIVVDRSNQIYFSDLETIWKIDAQGKLSVFRAGVSDRHIHELAMDEDGNLYGGELTYEPATQRYVNALWKITPEGSFAYTLSPTHNPPKGMSLWKDRDGNMYSALWKSNSEHELLLLKRTPEGKVSTLFGSAETADKFRQEVLYSVGGITFGEDGSLYVADGANIRKVAMNGAVTTLVRNLAPDNQEGKNADARLLGITVDAQGSVFAADNGNRRVLKFTPDGKVETLIRAEQPWSPCGVAFRNGNLYILENGFTPPRTVHGVRVRKLSSDGKITVLGNTGEKEISAALENSTNENAFPATVNKSKVPYILIGVLVGIFALSFVVWRVRRKIVYSASR
jgi:sugar lactone lactonase YvrE